MKVLMVKSKNKRNLYIAIGFVGILAIAITLFILNSTEILRAVGISKSVPAFTFNQSKAPNWWATENYNSQASMKNEKEYQGSEPIDKLSVARINVLKGKKDEYATACFVMFNYYDYKIDIAKLKAEKDAGNSKGGSKFQNVGDIQSSINTPEGDKSFTLTKYELSGPGTENSMKGMSYGWVELDEGYIQVGGVCPTAPELDDTAHVSATVSLVKH